MSRSFRLSGLAMSPISFNLRFLQNTLAIPLAFLLFGSAQVFAQTQENSKLLLSYQESVEQHSPATAPQQTIPAPAVIQAGFETAPSKKVETALQASIAEPQSDPRQLAPQSRLPTDLGMNGLGIQGPATGTRDTTKFVIPQIESLTTAGTGLAIVLGLFFVCIWLMRRSGPKPTTPLPKEAVAVLGRVPLAARNFAHLIQIGNKLVLVAITPEGVTPITEVTDPGEVDRLLGICLRKHKHSTSAEFHNVLKQLANEPAKGFLGNEAHAMSAGLRS